MPHAIGAQAAQPTRQVISLSSDGGFTILMGDLITLTQMKLPVKVVIFNNGVLCRSLSNTCSHAVVLPLLRGRCGLCRQRRMLSPSQAYAEARTIVDLIRDDAAKAQIKIHRLRGNVSVREGSGGNVAVLTGTDGKVFIDAGITATKPPILEAANSLSADPIKHLINTHWHFDHADGNVAARPRRGNPRA